MRVRVPRARLILWSFLFLSGAIAGMAGLVNIGHFEAGARICGREKFVHVAYAWPGQQPKDYSEDDIDVEDCYARHD